MVWAAVGSGGLVLGNGVAGVAGFGSAREIRLVIGGAGHGEFVGDPLVEIIGLRIVNGFAFLLRDSAMRIKRGFLISGLTQGPFLV
jgi:hypothetical protein